MCLITELQKYMKQKPKGGIDKSTARAGHFNTLVIKKWKEWTESQQGYRRLEQHCQTT